MFVVPPKGLASSVKSIWEKHFFDFFKEKYEEVPNNISSSNIYVESMLYYEVV